MIFEKVSSNASYFSILRYPNQDVLQRPRTPHFHAIYGEYELIVGISPITILEGKAPNRVRSMILEWTALHQEELSENWNRCRQGEQPSPIAPLE